MIRSIIVELSVNELGVDLDRVWVGHRYCYSSHRAVMSQTNGWNWAHHRLALLAYPSTLWTPSRSSPCSHGSFINLSAWRSLNPWWWLTLWDVHHKLITTFYFFFKKELNVMWRKKLQLIVTLHPYYISLYVVFLI